MYLVFLNSRVQTYISQRLASYISEQTHTPVSIEGVDFSPFKSLILKGLYIEDYQQDTLIYIGNLKAKVDSFNLDKKKLYINKLTLEETFVNLYEDKERTLNIEVFLDSLSGKKQTEEVKSDSKPWDISVSNVDMLNSQFGYKTVEFKPQEFGMNYDDIFVTDLNLKARDISIIGDSIDFQLHHLSCKEKSGFELKDFKAHSWITSHQWGLKDVNIVSKNSKLQAHHLYFNYVPNKKYWAKFTKKMKLDFQLKSSRISFLDLAYFNEILLGFRETGYLSGHLYGTIYNLRGKNIDIKYGENTALKGKFYMNGLPYLSDSYLDADFKELTTSIADIESVYIPGYTKEHFNLPEYFNNLGLIKYKGKFNGFINDFVFYGKFRTELGDLDTDILFKPAQGNNRLNFSGDLETTNFNLGGLIEQEKVGNITLNVAVNGYTEPGTTQGVMKGNIDNVYFYDYEYQNLSLDGFFSESKFDGKVSIEDENLSFDFSGKVDFSQEIPTMNFSSHLKNAKLFPLHLNTTDQKAELSLDINANFAGSSFDNANGIIEINNTIYKNSLGEINSKQFTINSFTSPDFKRIYLHSDFTDAEVEGNYEVVKLISSLANLAYYYLPAYAEDKEYLKIDSTNNFKFSLNLKETTPITKVLYPEVKLAANTNIEGELIAKDHKIDLHFYSDTLSVQGRTFDHLKIDLSTDHEKLILKGRTNKLSVTDNFRIYNLSHKITAAKNKVNFDLLWNNWDKSTYSGYLSAEGKVAKSENQKNVKWDIDLLPSTIIMADSIWNLPKSKIVIDSTSYEIDNFKVAREDQYFGLDGKISEDPRDSINFEIQNISLKNLNDLTRDQNIGVNGIVRGYVQLSDFYGQRLSNSNVMIEDLIFNRDTLGNLYLISDWDKTEKKLSFSSFTDYKNNKELEIQGNYFPGSDSLNMGINLNRLRLDLLNPYLQESISNLKGELKGHLNLEGPTDDIRSTGMVKFQNTSFMVNALKTTYHCNDSISITPKELQFNNFKLTDKNGENALLFGAIEHNQFNKFAFDLTLNTVNFNVLDTRLKDNELFYGEAFVTGVTYLSGSPDNLDVEITAKPEKDTRIYIPLNSSGDIQESDFITFVNNHQNSEKKIEEQYDIDLSGIKLNCDLEITPDTDIRIIFDSQSGDALKARGNGNLKLEIDTKGDFQMYGDYTIQKGSYEFKLQNLVNKKFDLSNGGNIKWSGDPYDATGNINAVYSLKTTLYDVLLNTPSIDKTRKVMVNCNMNLSQSLTNPHIKFGIDFPTLDQQTQSILEGMFAGEDEINKQILSLLVLNRFYTPEYLRSTDPDFDNKNSSYAVGVTTSELLSNQLSNWLSKISNDFDIGVSYRPGDNLTEDELELAMSTQIFDDKVTINGNIGNSASQNRDNDIVGDFDVNIRLDNKGKLQLKAFTRSNEYLVYEDSRNTQGVGIFYREDFNTFSGLLKKYLNFLNKKEEKKKKEAKP
jgi:hypothetical protein